MIESKYETNPEPFLDLPSKLNTSLFLTKSQKSLTKKEYDNLILEFDKSQKIEMTVEDLLGTNPQWSQRDRNFNIKFYRLIMNSLTKKQGS